MAENQEEPAGPAAFAGWTRAEKFYLLKALEVTDRRNIEEIQDYLPNKSYDEVKAAIDYAVQEAYKRPEYKEAIAKLHKKYYRPNKWATPADPLARWAEKIKKSYPDKELRTETAVALRMIAECESVPPPSATENVDFREVYYQLANAIEGKPVTADIPTTAVLKKCLDETMIASRAFYRHSSPKHLLKLVIDAADEERTETLFARTSDQELSVLRSFVSQRSYNPLNIPEAYLKPGVTRKQGSN
ncbi:hypothetical protein B5X24_HaOG201846 [Helicoverpa armigera]|nr:hypothetical protein B5X24_HaOG201846 [Helicoverpa armigera]